MKNHIAFKIAAVLLAAILLLSAIVSGCGIVLLSNYDLYNQTWEEIYEENMRDTREGFAQALVFRFASMELGGCSTPLIDAYYGNGAIYTSYQWGRYAYTVRSKNDEELITLDREIPNAEHFEIPVTNGRFIYLISEKDVEDTTEERLNITEPTVPPATVPETVPPTTAAATEPPAPTVSAVTEEAAPAEGETSEEEAEEPEASEEETPEEDTASAEETAAEEVAAEETEAASEEVSDQNAETEAAAEETAAEEETAAAGEEPSAEETPEGEESQEDGSQKKKKKAAKKKEAEEAAAAAETAPVTEAPTQPATVPTEPQLQPAPEEKYRANPYFTRDQYDEAFSFPYYNYESGSMKDATLCYANTSDYTVDLYLAPDALYDYQMWNLLKVIAPLRGELFAVLGGSLLLFTVLIAYLFCAAGRKPGSAEIVPMGFNQMPLDLYLALLGIGILGCIQLTAKGTEIFSNTQMLQMMVAAGACFLGCLIAICFSIACAAQVKMKDHYWLRNTVVFRALWMLSTGTVWVSKKLWVQSRYLPELWQWMGQHLRKWTHKLLQLMPTMYQWLACTGVTLLILLLGAIFRNVFLLILGFLAAAALAVYGGYCFSILLQGVKRMRAGDLKTKVHSDALVGSMKEFSEELNGLADVAGEAADKQLKSERMKTELITNVSHDIKTPLTSIINYVDLMERPHTKEEQIEYMEVLSRQAQRLKKLIEDLMEMSKASTGNMQTDITQVNAEEAINQCLGEFTDKLAKADLIPVFHTLDHEVTMMADGRLVWRVMSNLLGNVVKYALPGTRVYIDLNELEEDVVISVKNVSREELNISSDELMERFVRGDASRNTEGSGLGLNIARSLMELQHGQMELLVDGDLFKVTLIFPRN